MKKFITLSVVFAFITLTLTVSLVGGIYLIQSKVSFKLPEGKHILVLGNSRTEQSVDDRIFSRATNFSQGAEAYLYSYCKLRKFLAENEQVDTVLLSFRGRTVRLDDEQFFSKMYMADKIPHYLTLLEREDIAVFSGEKASFIYAVLQSPFLFFKEKIFNQASTIGAYFESHRNKLQVDIMRRNRKADRERDANISIYQKTYLLKIAELCKSKDVELILLNVPMYKPEVYGEKELSDDFHEAYMPDVKYMDYSSFPLPDSCYGDITHLNYRGARIFSQYLQERFSADVKEIGEGNRWVYGEPAE
ncbi:MAG: hypothetical protein LBH72_03445 [Proteiniphilum sp.]|jgi:hypothetical protein|nr:hypothetical protein [Proteiniphilum sp.]